MLTVDYGSTLKIQLTDVKKVNSLTYQWQKSYSYVWFIQFTGLVHQIWTSNFEYETPILSRLYYILLTRATAIFNYGKLLWRLPWLSFARETFCTSSSPEIRNYSCKARKKVNFLTKMQKKKIWTKCFKVSC